jgi:thiosulfate/3-mercaptopyruvate sulfurtransferase
MFPRRVFVSVAEVAPVLASLRVLDVRYNLENPHHYGIGEYLKLRIAGASFIDLDAEATGPLTGTTARHPLPAVKTFIDLCVRRGIGKLPVLCYDDQAGGMAASRVWWMLQSLGVEAYVLEGGIQAYIAGGLPTESGDQRPEEIPLPEWPYANQFAKVLELNELPLNAKIVDGRFAIRYNSTVRPYGADPIPGCMPGAINHPWNANMDESVAGQRKLLSEETLRSKWSKTLPGTTDVKDMVFTCASGVTACYNIAVVQHLGLGMPYLYSGAWSEYCGLHRFHLQRQVIAAHGFCFTMKTKALAMNPKATPANSTLIVEGSTTTFEDADELTRTAAAHLHIGERGIATFASGETRDIEVLPRA